jgi:hypothetical protein
MILDKNLQFDASGTAASAIVTGGVDSTNTIDLLNARDMMPSTDDMRLELVFTVQTALTASGGAASLIIKIQGSADNSTYTVLGQSDSGGMAKALLVAGAQIRVPFPSIAGNLAAALPRYIKATYVAVTNNFTGGTFECDLVLDSQANNPVSYPAGITVAN